MMLPVKQTIADIPIADSSTGGRAKRTLMRLPVPILMPATRCSTRSAAVKVRGRT
jgi:hypothetical protein